MLKAVFFDMYGTLAQFYPSRYEVQSKACVNFNIKLTPDGVIAGYKSADQYMSEENSLIPIRLRDGKDKATFFAEYERRVLKGAGVEVTNEQAGEIWRHLKMIKYKLKIFEDVMPSLSILRERGLILGMVSNIDRLGSDIVQALGIGSAIDFTVTSAEVEAEKPDPAIFRAALNKSGVLPGEAVHVGDQTITDIEGAIGAGIKAILLDRDGNYPGFDRCPRIESMLELPKLLDLY